MPSLRIHFPEKETPTTVVLKGSRISIGRTASNTIQILDRTVSATHAELIAESDGHYRLHDTGSTNGTRVNEEAVRDYHLKEPCKVSFGNLECDFAVEASTEANGEEVEVLPTRSEMEALRQVNGELRRNLDLLREEVEGLKKTQPAQGAEGDSPAVLSAELQRLVLERAESKESEQRHAQELEHLKSELALVKRDRINLENALRHSNAENERLKKEQGTAPADAAPAAPVAQTPPPAPMETASTAEATAPAAPPAPPKAVPAPSPVPKATPVPTPAKPEAPAAPLKPYPPISKPSLPPPSAPSLAPAGAPSAAGLPSNKPVPKFVPGSRPAAPPVPQKAAH
jgi:hypothetical protein